MALPNPLPLIAESSEDGAFPKLLWGPPYPILQDSDRLPFSCELVQHRNTPLLLISACCIPQECWSKIKVEDERHSVWQ